MSIPCLNTCVTNKTFISLSNNELNLAHMTNKNIRSHNEVNITNDKVELCETVMSVKLLVIVIIDFKRYSSTYCLMQGS